MTSYKTSFKDFENIPELKELLPVIDDLNNVLANIVVYRSHKHRETYFNDEGFSIEKKHLQLDFAIVTGGVSRSGRPLSSVIEVEVDLEKCKQHLEEFRKKYEKWLLKRESKRAEKAEKRRIEKK